ncbi:hypothetical protein Hypma_002424 [Hypsizygus marmoreus]|uniref:Cytochrome P450 67 n=1 Tax=Hypsizygus marmoreus TaxID=39966 RepID=A0A369JDG9_HYPMA|nr:hypothetical protein Hypma_002424 [Hypsizygus marmoreus]
MMDSLLLAPLTAGIICHGVYNKLEPRQLLWHVALLVLVPLSMTPLLLPLFSNVIWAALVAWSVYLATLATSITVYRLSPFHPLAKYPGPLLCKISKIYFAFVSSGGKQHIYYQQLHLRYGDIVRIGPNELSFCTPDAIAPMMGTGGMPKAAFWDAEFPLQKENRSLVGLRNPHDHARRRRIWSRGFTAEAIKSYKPLLERRVDQLVENLTQRAGQTVDLAQWLSWFTYDVMNDLAFGRGAELMQNEDAGGLWHLMKNAMPTALLVGHLPWLAEYYIRIPAVANAFKLFIYFALERVKQRYTEGPTHKDLFYHLMDEAGLEDTPPNLDQAANDGELAILAGSDTVSPTLSNLFWLLLCNPIAYARLKDEIDAAKISVGDVTAQAQLPYLNAVINETMRLFPALLSGSIRAPLVGGGGHWIGPHFLPDGTTAYVHTYTLQRDKRNFSPLPEKFLPERWLLQEQQDLLEPSVFGDRTQVVHNTTAFIPFSYGPADCIGKRLGLQEMRMAVVAIMQRLKFRFAGGFDQESWEAEMRDYFLLSLGRLPVIVNRRM